VTAYFSFVRQSEEMRVFIGEVPLLTRADDGRLQVEGNLDVAFMNTGTRPIIVFEADFVIEDVSAQKGEDRPCGLKFGTLPFEGASFVVKEKESVAKLLKLKFDPRNDIAKLTEDGRVSVLAPKNSRGEPSRHVVTCVRIAGATPSRKSLTADIRLADFEWSDQGHAAIGYPTIAFSVVSFLPPPAVIWTKLGTIFNMD